MAAQIPHYSVPGLHFPGPDRVRFENVVFSGLMPRAFNFPRVSFRAGIPPFSPFSVVKPVYQFRCSFRPGWRAVFRGIRLKHGGNEKRPVQVGQEQTWNKVFPGLLTRLSCPGYSDGDPHGCGYENFIHHLSGHSSVQRHWRRFPPGY